MPPTKPTYFWLIFGILSISYLVEYLFKRRSERDKGIQTQGLTFKRIMLLILGFIILIVILMAEIIVTKIININQKYVGLVGGMTGIIYGYFMMKKFK